LTDRVKIDMICKISLMCQKVSHKTKVQHSVNNKPRAPLTGLRDPIIKRGRERESDEKKSKKNLCLHCSVSWVPLRELWRDED